MVHVTRPDISESDAAYNRQVVMTVRSESREPQRVIGRGGGGTCPASCRRNAAAKSAMRSGASGLGHLVRTAAPG